MKRNIRGFFSTFLALVMVFNMLPLHAFAEEAVESRTSKSETSQEAVAEDVYIVKEIVEKRSEYIKEFQLSNGLHLATVYASPVHYEANGQWEEIDNTLQLSNTHSGNAYINTAGVWQVSLPQSLRENNGISITKDGYALNFRMAGELHDADMQIDVSEAEELPAIPEEPVIRAY